MDPISLCELAQSLRMSVTELLHGRGTPTSLEEMVVWWPAYWGYQNREQQRQIKEAEKEQSGGRL